MFTLELKCLERVAIGDPDIADVKTLGDGELLLVGSSIGDTTLLAWTCDGLRHSYNVRISPNFDP